MFFLYILLCADKTLYTGVAVDLKKRVGEHNHSKSGAKYTRSRRPVKLVFTKRFRTKSQALKAEYTIKRLTRQQKLSVVRNGKL